MTLILTTTVLSDPGLVRANNEDAAITTEWLAAVADGMGGLPAGEVASEILIELLAELTPPPSSTDAAAALDWVVHTANQRIRAAVDQDPARDGMGSTFTAVILTGDELTVAQVGDSRCYLLRDWDLHQLTHDDTYVQSLIDQGQISPEDAWQHPQRALVTRAVQGADSPPTLGAFSVAVGDRLMLCSDGLSDYVPDQSIRAVLGAYLDQRQCVEQLVKLAHQAGAPDNVTVVVADVVDAPIW